MPLAHTGPPSVRYPQSSFIIASVLTHSPFRPSNNASNTSLWHHNPSGSAESSARLVMRCRSAIMVGLSACEMTSVSPACPCACIDNPPAALKGDRLDQIDPYRAQKHPNSLPMSMDGL